MARSRFSPESLDISDTPKAVGQDGRDRPVDMDEGPAGRAACIEGHRPLVAKVPLFSVLQPLACGMDGGVVAPIRSAQPRRIDPSWFVEETGEHGARERALPPASAGHRPDLLKGIRAVGTSSQHVVQVLQGGCHDLQISARVVGIRKGLEAALDIPFQKVQMGAVSARVNVQVADAHCLLRA